MNSLSIVFLSRFLKVRPFISINGPFLLATLVSNHRPALHYHIYPPSRFKQLDKHAATVEQAELLSSYSILSLIQCLGRVPSRAASGLFTNALDCG